MMSKETTKGPDAHPFFRRVVGEAGFFAKPRWNFYKYLINRKGELEDYFISATSPSAKRFTNALELLFYS